MVGCVLDEGWRVCEDSVVLLSSLHSRSASVFAVTALLV